MLQWFIRFHEFAKITEYENFAPFRKNSIVIADSEKSCFNMILLQFSVDVGFCSFFEILNSHLNMIRNGRVKQCSDQAKAKIFFDVFHLSFDIFRLFFDLFRFRVCFRLVWADL